jgi:hypothetical protein
MDLRHYYHKIREAEAKIPDEYPLLMSFETGDGGKGGTCTEVPRRLAAQKLVDGVARLATAEEKEAYHAAHAEARRAVEQLAAANKVQFAVLTSAELDRLKGKPKT